MKTKSWHAQGDDGGHPCICTAVTVMSEQEVDAITRWFPSHAHPLHDIQSHISSNTYKFKYAQVQTCISPNMLKPKHCDEGTLKYI